MPATAATRIPLGGEHIEEGIHEFDNRVECHRSGDEDEAEWHMRRRAPLGAPSYACHTRAVEGSYAGAEVRIPGIVAREN